MGRKKKTAEERIKDGTYRKDRDTVEVSLPLPAVGLRPAPADMPLVAVDLWNATCDALDKAGVLIALAYPQIENYCLSYYVWQQHKKILYVMAEPGTETFSNGNRGTNKDFEAVVKARGLMSAFEAAWGLTPAAGLAINPPDNSDNEFDI